MDASARGKILMKVADLLEREKDDLAVSLEKIITVISFSSVSFLRIWFDLSNLLNRY